MLGVQEGVQVSRAAEPHGQDTAGLCWSVLGNREGHVEVVEVGMRDLCSVFPTALPC